MNLVLILVNILEGSQAYYCFGYVNSNCAFLEPEEQ